MARTEQIARTGGRGGKAATFPWGRAPVPAGVAQHQCLAIKVAKHPRAELQPEERLADEQATFH